MKQLFESIWNMSLGDLVINTAIGVLVAMLLVAGVIWIVNRATKNMLRGRN